MVMQRMRLVMGYPDIAKGKGTVLFKFDVPDNAPRSIPPPPPLPVGAQPWVEPPTLFETINNNEHSFTKMPTAVYDPLPLVLFRTKETRSFSLDHIYRNEEYIITTVAQQSTIEQKTEQIDTQHNTPMATDQYSVDQSIIDHDELECADLHFDCSFMDDDSLYPPTLPQPSPPPSQPMDIDTNDSSTDSTDWITMLGYLQDPRNPWKELTPFVGLDDIIRSFINVHAAWRPCITPAESEALRFVKSFCRQMCEAVNAKVLHDTNPPHQRPSKHFRTQRKLVDRNLNTIKHLQITQF